MTMVSSPLPVVGGQADRIGHYKCTHTRYLFGSAHTVAYTDSRESFFETGMVKVIDAGRCKGAYHYKIGAVSFRAVTSSDRFHSQGFSVLAVVSAPTYRRGASWRRILSRSGHHLAYPDFRCIHVQANRKEPNPRCHPTRRTQGCSPFNRTRSAKIRHSNQ